MRGIHWFARAGRRRWLATASSCVVAACFASILVFSSAAQAEARAGRVVALDRDDIMIDMGAKEGLSVGTTIELWRPLRVKHPVTGQILTDKFQIGTLRVTQVGEKMSIAEPTAPLHRAAQAGDIIISHVEQPVIATPTMSSVQPSPTPVASSSVPIPVSPEDAESKALSAMFDSLRGTDPVHRIRTYEDYVRSRPNGRYSRVLFEEAQSLRRLVLQHTQGDEQESDAPKLVAFDSPGRVFAGAPFELGLALHGKVKGALLHVRATGSDTYQSFSMTDAGNHHFTAKIPEAMIRPPSIEYFIEAVNDRGESVPLQGSAAYPDSIGVDKLPQSEPRDTKQYSALLLTDYADYDRLLRKDWAWQTEGIFGVRFGDVGMRALRSGFGVYRGAGGSVQELDVQDRQPRAIGLTYGYLEAEYGFTHGFSLLGRGVVGLRDAGTAGGGQLLFRIGNDRKTNFLIGGEILDGVGMRSITQLELNMFPRVPIMLRTEVTNQPAGMSSQQPRASDPNSPKLISGAEADLGARAIIQVGYRLDPKLTVALRGSFQGRTIRHAGPGVGAAISYEW